jgi:hypothetical protein
MGGTAVSLRDLFKRQVDNLLSTERDRPHVSLEDDLRQQFDQALGDAIDPGRELREAEREAASRERIRTQAGFGQFVQIDGIAGQWEAVELMYFDETSASFTLVDRLSGDTAQLSAVDDGTVILDSPGDQHGSTIPGAFWRTATSTGIRLSAAVLTADDRRIAVTCDLSADLPADGPVD